MSLDTILNHVKVTDTLSTSGQPEKSQFADIAAAGYEVVINLSLSDSSNAIVDESSIVAALGMSYVHIPVVFENPTKLDLQRFLQTMLQYNHKKIWVHCAFNYRASAFIFHYLRLLSNKSDREAKSKMLLDWKPDQVWQEFLSLSCSDLRQLINPCPDNTDT